MYYSSFCTHGLLRQYLIAMVAGATWCTVSLASVGGAWHRQNNVTISGTPPISVTAGQAYAFTPSATDSEGAGRAYSFQPSASGLSGTTLSYSVANKPSWAEFSVATGRLSGAPTASNVGITSGIVISVSDGKATSALPAFSIQVAAAAVTGAGGTATQSLAVAETSTTPPTGSSCSATNGSLSLKARAVRAAGISPFLVFFDATGTTDSAITGNTTAFQDISYSWNFGDTGASGTDTWAYGSNAGRNSRNTAVGGVGAHLYVTPGVDMAHVVTVTAHNGANTASCQLEVKAYDPAGANGFPGTKTTCVSASGTPTAGSGGCPAGAAVLKQSNFGSALSASFGSKKRVLFKCGDRFTGSYGIGLGISTWSIGAYGGCENTQSNRPIVTNGGGITITLNASNTSPGPVDGRITDLDFEGGASAAVSTSSGFNVTQVTLYNLYANGLQTAYYISGGTQNGIVQSVQTGMTTRIGTFLNYAQNNCANGSASFNCGGSPVYSNVDYNALLGSSFNGQGATTGSNGIEVVRVSACRMCVIANNTFENANNVGAVLKLHNGNTWNTQSTWIGQYTELVEISDNLFTGTSGAQLVETSPQNGVTDERLRNIVVERNVFAAATGGGRQILVSAVNETVRNNAFYGQTAIPTWFIQVAERGIEPVPQGVELYNNTCYGGGTCAGFSGQNFAAAGNNSYASNNLFFSPGGGATVSNSGTGNSVSNNTVSSSSNPGFTNASGTFRFISDFRPSADYSGGTSVPVWYDALGTPLSSSWDLGAVHP